MAHDSAHHKAGHGKSKEYETLKQQGASGEQLLEASLYSRLRDPSAAARFKTPALLALSGVFGTACAEYNAAFIECKTHHKNPEHCLDEGALVTRCSDNVWQLVRERCLRSFHSYSQCLNSNNLEFSECRAQQTAFNTCINEADPALGAALKDLAAHNAKTRPPSH